MATRPVFLTNYEKPYYTEIAIEFHYYSGFAPIQYLKSINSLHSAIGLQYPDSQILEISTKSDIPLGRKLSAFNLTYKLRDKEYPVELLFQSGKQFINGGPYSDLLKLSPYEVKKDKRLTNSGNIIAFQFNNYSFPIEPKTYFYDWLYINALVYNESELEGLMEYSGFTDIAFNPQKSINCQARAAAIYVSLKKMNLLNRALSSPENFRHVIYLEDNTTTSMEAQNYYQESLFQPQ